MCARSRARSEASKFLIRRRVRGRSGYTQDRARAGLGDEEGRRDWALEFRQAEGQCARSSPSPPRVPLPPDRPRRSQPFLGDCASRSDTAEQADKGRLRHPPAHGPDHFSSCTSLRAPSDGVAVLHVIRSRCMTILPKRPDQRRKWSDNICLLVVLDVFAGGEVCRSRRSDPRPSLPICPILLARIRIRGRPSVQRGCR